MATRTQTRSMGHLVRRVAAGVVMMALGAAAGEVATEPSPGLATSPGTRGAQTLPSAPMVNVTVTDWSVWVVDAGRAELNRKESYGNTLPPFVEDLRNRVAGDNEYGPVGMIRIAPAGPVNADLTVDVQVSFKTGQVLGRWPAGKIRGGGGILWQDIHFAGEKETLRALPEGSWLADARRGVERNVLVGSVAEGFLLYDLELVYPVLLQVANGQKGAYKVAQGTTAPLLNVTFYRHEGSGWRTATIARLEKPASGVAGEGTGTMPAGVSAMSVAPPASQPIVRATTRGAGPSATSPRDDSSPPIVAATLPGAIDVALGTESLPATRALESWQPVLTQAGLSAVDRELMLKILAHYALDPRRLTAVYRIDPAELEKLLPLEIVPEPRKISRVALVIVTGIDPAIAEELEQLVAQLGSASWEKREAAMEEIKKLGQKARPQLIKAAKDKDVEVVYRAEQLLQLLAEEGAPAPAQ